MDEITEGVLNFIRWVENNPLPPDAPTCDVLRALRERLDVDSPGWRLRAFQDTANADAVEVEVHLSSGRVVRGVLAQRPSGVRGEAA
jgi:hypothetical protein